ncbi:hypothetical protein EGW08_009871, partial [Elysia chlorotica]
AQKEGRTVHRSRFNFFKTWGVNPDSYLSIHKTIFVTKYAAYYFGSEKTSGQPKLVKIFRPTLTWSGRRRAGMEKHILSLDSRPAAMPSLHFAFSYQVYLCLVMEPMFNEPLDVKVLYGRCLMPDVVHCFFLDMVCAVGFLHHNGILHRDLNLSSFWIQGNRHLKLTDYNHCIDRDSHERFYTLFGVKTTDYTAPELLNHDPYSRQSDIWALGIIFYRITRGRMLMKDPLQRLGHDRDTYEAFQNQDYFADVNWENAHRQTRRGPPITWRFCVSTEEEILDEKIDKIKFEDV